MDVRMHSIERAGTSRETSEELHQMLSEMRIQNFDVIRFAAYRTACKLRYIQKRTNMNLIDIWNVIEAFRENCFNTLESKSDVSVSKLEGLIASMYSQLNKRLPGSQQINVEASTSLFLKWFVSALDTENSGKIQVFAIKVTLAVISAGKLIDKFRYIFSQVSDGNGQMVLSKFVDFLKEILLLPRSVFEAPSFCYNDSLVNSIFDGKGKITVNDFLDTLMSDPGPQCLLWLSLFHRMANVENVLHPVQCDGCHRASFMGFRYKCQRCYNYQLCQDCFWRGRTSGGHTNEHQMKEYTSYKSTGKQIRRSLRKSFRCIPDKPDSSIPKFPDQPEKPLNLSHIVPPSPMPVHNGYHPFSQSFEISSIDSSPSRMNSLESSKVDDEHKLIARYAARLAANSSHPGRSPSELSLDIDNSKAQRELIAQLESKNREILKEISVIKHQQEVDAKAEQNPLLLAELQSLRDRKKELESHLSHLQESRRELMMQLEGLMKLLKNHHNSPKSTPNSSPHSMTSSKSPPVLGSNPQPQSFTSAPTTPGSNLSSIAHSTDHQCSDDDAYSSLGRLRLQDSKGFDTEDTESDMDTSNTLWREDFKRRLAQENQFLAEIRARRKASVELTTSSPQGTLPSSQPAVVSPPKDSPVSAPADDEKKDEGHDEEEDDEEIREFYNNTYYHHSGGGGGGGVTTDDESYVRTDDDDDGGGTDWEDNMRRWINR